MTTTIEIKKVKVLSQYQVFVKYETFTQKTEDKPSINCEIEATLRHEVHQDLLDALEDIKPHLISMCSQPDNGQYEINQVVWGGDGEYRGVTLCGNRQLVANRKLNLNTPFCSFNEDVAWYENWYGLEAVTAKLEAEVIEYLNGKHAPSKQLEMEFSEYQPTIKED